MSSTDLASAGGYGGRIGNRIGWKSFSSSFAGTAPAPTRSDFESREVFLFIFDLSRQRSRNRNYLPPEFLICLLRGIRWIADIDMVYLTSRPNDLCRFAP